MTTGEPGAQPGDPQERQGHPQPQGPPPEPQGPPPQPPFDKPAEPAWAPPPPQYGAAPPYGQYGPQYGPPPQASYGAPPQAGYGGPAPSRGRIGLVGAVVALVGVVGVVLALTVLRWFTSDRVGTIFRAVGNRRFGRVHDALEAGHDQIPAQLSRFVDFGISRAYFSWLAWVLFALAVVVAIVALLPTRASLFLRIVGIVVGLAAIAFTFWAIDLVSLSGPVANTAANNPRYGDYFSHTNVGFWFAAVGFLLIGVGTVIGPRRS